MNCEELKKKIVEVINQKQTYGIKEEFKTEDLGHGGWQAWTETTKVNNAEIADALIAAGIGFKDKHRVFVKNVTLPKNGDCDAFFVPNTQLKITQLYGDEEVEQIVKERDEYKYRAEVAERALQIADELGELCGRKEDYVQQAEKELAEEGKDD